MHAPDNAFKQALSRPLCWKASFGDGRCLLTGAASGRGGLLAGMGRALLRQ